MTLLTRSGIPVESIFAIHGSDENDLSDGLAYLLAASHSLRRKFLLNLLKNSTVPTDEDVIALQTGRRGIGVTDIELQVGDEVHVVIEAKKGADYPSATQLARYAKILGDSEANDILLVAVTALDDDVAHLNAPELSTVEVPHVHRSWKWVRRLTAEAYQEESSYRLKFLLSEFWSFLEAFLGLERMYSNYTYVVSLGTGYPEGWDVSWIEVVEKYHKYFYPAGAKGWPTPPNYIAFRYYGRLQSIHHVDRYTVVDDLARHFGVRGSGDSSESHYLLELGPPIKPPHEVRTGPRIHRSARVWCMLDTLLTSSTISDALTLTEERVAAAQDDQ